MPIFCMEKRAIRHRLTLNERRKHCFRRAEKTEAKFVCEIHLIGVARKDLFLNCRDLLGIVISANAEVPALES